MQLAALQANDQPWANHGIQTAYEFGEDIGGAHGRWLEAGQLELMLRLNSHAKARCLLRCRAGLDPSWYFGFRKDLYHLDHFLGHFGNQLGELVDNCGFSVEEVLEGPEAARPSEQHTAPHQTPEAVGVALL